MSAFVVALRSEVDQAGRALDQAQQAGDAGAVHRHGARLLDLLQRAATHGVDTTDWVPAVIVALASTAAGNDA